MEAYQAAGGDAYKVLCFCDNTSPQSLVFTTSCSRCHHPVRAHPNMMCATQRLCDACVSDDRAPHTVYTPSYTLSYTTSTAGTAPSSSGEYGDSPGASKYGEQPTQDERLRELDGGSDLALAPPPQMIDHDEHFAPPLVAGFRGPHVTPVPVRVTPKQRAQFRELARIFASGAHVEPWPAHGLTWLSVTHAWWLGRVLEPLPAQTAVLASRLRHNFPAGITAFYLDAKSVDHYRTGNALDTPSIPSAVSRLRIAHGMCALIFTRGRVAILEVLTHPGHTRRGARIRSLVEEAAEALGWQL